MNKSINQSGTELSPTEVSTDDPRNREVLDVERLLGQRRAFAAVGGRCSVANAQLLRRIRDQKLYCPVAPSWRAFCTSHLDINRRRADRLIALLNRFGPIYFELAELIGLSPRQYLALEPAVREDKLLVDGEAISFIPENAAKIRQAVTQILNQPGRGQRPDRTPQSLGARLAHLTGRGRIIANQIVALYHSAHSGRDRELILEAATELRLILMQPGNE